MNATDKLLDVMERRACALETAHELLATTDPLPKTTKRADGVFLLRQAAGFELIETVGGTTGREKLIGVKRGYQLTGFGRQVLRGAMPTARKRRKGERVWTLPATPFGDMTPEEKIDALQNRVTELEYLLGLDPDSDAMAKLHRAFSLAPFPANVVLKLFAAKGRVCSSGALAEGGPQVRYQRARIGDSNSVAVHISRVRKALGEDAVATSWGEGYAMTPEGLSKMKAALDAPLETV